MANLRVDWGRRGFLTVGALGGLGLSLGDYFRLKEAQADEGLTKEGVAKSVIYIYLPGGMAHQETFDPKPYAPVEYRGPLSSIETNVPGVRVGQYLPQTAQIADKLAICRSMSDTAAPDSCGRFSSDSRLAWRWKKSGSKRR